MKDEHTDAVFSSGRWDAAVRRVSADGHYLDAFLGELKREKHLNLIERWGGVPLTGRTLKTDLFEEATGPDAYLPELAVRGGPAFGMDISPYLGRSYTVRELRQALESTGFVVEGTTAILQNPRLTAVAAVTIARKLGWRPLVSLVQRAIVAAQRLEATRFRYYFGSFVAARAVRRS